MYHSYSAHSQHYKLYKHGIFILLIKSIRSFSCWLKGYFPSSFAIICLLFIFFDHQFLSSPSTMWFCLVSPFVPHSLVSFDVEHGTVYCTLNIPIFLNIPVLGDIFLSWLFQGVTFGHLQWNLLRIFNNCFWTKLTLDKEYETFHGNCLFFVIADQ